MYEFYKCIMLGNRKENNKKEEKIDCSLNKFIKITECSWLGCGLELKKPNDKLIKAKIKDKYYIFCGEECYHYWLKTNYFI